MIDLSADVYVWVKALHIIFVIAWMAGLLYLPRLFVYHSEAEPNSPQSETFKKMERKLLRGIINPSMVMVFILGIILFGNLDSAVWVSKWLIGKIVLVALLLFFHALAARWYKDFAVDNNNRSSLFFRLVNEIPALLMVGIVILAVVRPN